MAERLPAERLVLDGETLTLGEDGRPRAFQDTMSRFGADAVRPDILQPFFFDLLHLDGMDLVDLPLRRPPVLLGQVAGPLADPWDRHRRPGDGRGLPRRRRIAEGHEGVMVKAAARATRRAGGARRG